MERYDGLNPPFVCSSCPKKTFGDCHSLLIHSVLAHDKAYVMELHDQASPPEPIDNSLVQLLVPQIPKVVQVRSWLYSRISRKKNCEKITVWSFNGLKETIKSSSKLGILKNIWLKFSSDFHRIKYFESPARCTWIIEIFIYKL